MPQDFQLIYPLYIPNPPIPNKTIFWVRNDEVRRDLCGCVGGLVEDFFGGGGAVGVGSHHDVDAFEWVGGFGA